MLKAEEERFGETLENGMKILEAQLAKDSKGSTAPPPSPCTSTYGFPLGPDRRHLPRAQYRIRRGRLYAAMEQPGRLRAPRQVQEAARLSTRARRTSSSATTT
jgi:alanyl-tRNA synthetase